jgi:hypothetical protein
MRLSFFGVIAPQAPPGPPGLLLVPPWLGQITPLTKVICFVFSRVTTPPYDKACIASGELESRSPEGVPGSQGNMGSADLGSSWLPLAPKGSWSPLALPGSLWLPMAFPGSPLLPLAAPCSPWLLLAPPSAPWLLAFLLGPP